LNQFAGNWLYRTFPKSSEEFLSILWPRSLRDVHYDDCEFGKLLKGLGSGFTKELIPRQEAFEAGIDGRAH